MNRFIHLLPGVFLLVIAIPCSAQNISEWWRQKRTQRTYLLEQIYALNIQQRLLRTGYGITGEGLGDISGFKNKEYRVHKGYFSSLTKVPVRLKHDIRIAKIQAQEAAVAQLLARLQRQLQEEKRFTEAELASLQRISENIVAAGKQDLVQLRAVLSDHTYQMTDAQRLDQLERLFVASRQRYRLACALAERTKMVSHDRQAGINGLNIIQQLHSHQNNER